MNSTKVKEHLGFIKKMPLSRSLPLMEGYLKELKKEAIKKTLFIESAVALTASQIEEIKKTLTPRFLILNIETKINPSLLGGVKIKIGDMVYNDSLSAKINQLRKVV